DWGAVSRRQCVSFLFRCRSAPPARSAWSVPMKAWMTAGALALATLMTACDSGPTTPEVVVYTSRGDHLIKPVFDAYTAETGVRVRYITDNDAALLTRLESEGAQSPADLLITVDAGNLWQAAERGLLQPVDNAELKRAVP